jgi:uncharacterized membrane protein
MIHVRRSVIVRRSREDVYEFWRDLENLPRFMQHLELVEVTGDRTSHWIAKGPAGRSVEWEAWIVEDIPNEAIAWKAVGGSEIPNSGMVRFREAPGDRGTILQVELHYDPPAGAAGAAFAKLFGEEPAQQVRDDLRRFKQVMETGEVVRSDGSLEGAGQGARKQRPSRPSAESVAEARP